MGPSATASVRFGHYYEMYLVGVMGNLLVMCALLLFGGDWRYPLPAGAMALTLVQLTVGAVNVAFGRQNVVVSLLQVVALIAVSSVIGALATRPIVTSLKIAEWAQVYGCYAAIALALSGVLRFGGFSRTDGEMESMHVKFHPLNLLWLTAVVSIAIVGCFTTRPVPRAFYPGWILVGPLFAVLATTAALVAVYCPVRPVERKTSVSTTQPSRQWTLHAMMSLVTVVCICLGIALAIRPSWSHHHIAAMLAVEGVGLALFSIWCGILSKHARAVIWLPLLLCPAIWFSTALLGIGQANSYLQVWFAGDHQRDLDYGLSSSYWIRVEMYAVIAVVAVAYGRLLAARGIGISFGTHEVSGAAVSLRTKV